MNVMTPLDAFGAPDTWWEMAVRLLIAIACGAAVGFDRERRDRPAGLRTYMMVSLGAAAFTLVALQMVDAFKVDDRAVSMDPTRLISGIIGGVGFLGAGAIIQSGGRVRGLTTAAGLWLIAAVGMASGAGSYGLAAMLTVLAMIILAVVHHVERAMGDPEKTDEAGGDGG